MLRITFHSCTENIHGSLMNYITKKKNMNGHFINIGLKVCKESVTGLKIGQDVDPRSIISFLSENVKASEIVTDRDIVEEDTLVIELYRKIDDISMNIIMNMFGQEAIPQLSNGIGKMHGSKRWGEFNEDYFITIN